VSDDFSPNASVLIEHLSPDGPVKATIVRKMEWACECGGASWLCDIPGHGPHTVCASAIRRPH